MKKRNEKAEPSCSDYIELNRQSFWIFNNGAGDRFRFFKEEEQKKIETDQKRQQNQIAYNYQRVDLEIEESEWLYFYQQLTDQFFRTYDCVRVDRNGRIYGMKNGNSHLLTTHPEAYRIAQAAQKYTRGG